MRIVGGEARGRTLRTVSGSATRPTADRVRQSLFDRLGQRCDGLAVLDLFAGTGALALEALSRGAASATLVERDRGACEAISANIEALAYGARCVLVRDEVALALPRLGREGRAFDLVFADPPYALKACQATLDALRRCGLLAPRARVVLEREKREPLAAPPGFALEERRYGDTIVAIVEPSGGTGPSDR
ncbi:MAG: 16S rRNA (guanine(966)-N(2))-methyltransferase RsmD [Myxococcales bacterium]